MPIDPDFQKKREKVGKEEGIAIWGPVEPPEKLGIHGTYVAVDWDICTGCGVCLKVCPQQLYEWEETSGHPTSEKKAFPARELDCVQCYKCETKCPTQAIRIVYYPSSGQGLTGWLVSLAAYLLFLQAIGGTIYGALFGPSLGLQTLFYVGWLILPVALLFLFSLVIYFKRDGKPGEGKGARAYVSNTICARAFIQIVSCNVQETGSLFEWSYNALHQFSSEDHFLQAL